MAVHNREELSALLTKAATALDIPEDLYENATLKYEDVGSWLAADDSKLRLCSPDIYPQGSFRLGTVVRPLSEKAEFDIDLVCCLELLKERISQEELKEMVGDRLRLRDDLARILDSSCRCWVLKYPHESDLPHFHMDILPSIPNRERAPTGILISDRDLFHWQKSNPKAYANWFFSRMSRVFEEKRAIVAKASGANLEDVQYWQVKTPLQVAVQILKRHRDIHFLTSREHSPSSILITTLAAGAYKGQRNSFDAIVDAVQTMPSLIEDRHGQLWVVNPADPDENFADKWNKYPERFRAFQKWIQKAQHDFSEAGSDVTLRESFNSLAPALGHSVVAKAAADLGIRTSFSLPSPALPEQRIPALGPTGHCLLPAWPINLKYKARVAGSLHKKQGFKKLWGLAGRSVPKEMALRFEVTTNTPKPFDVKWQVVNTGYEAAAAGGLRGDFYESDAVGSNVRWETTLYRGTHWVEAFILKDGECVARSGKNLVKIRE